jgi:hypothetical protein
MHPCLRKLKPGDTLICDRSLIYYFAKFIGRDQQYIVVKADPNKEGEAILHPSHYFEIKIFKAPTNESLVKQKVA